MEKSDLACKAAEDLDVKDTDTSYLWVDIVLSSVVETYSPWLVVTHLWIWSSNLVQL